jgi:putative membrane protein
LLMLVAAPLLVLGRPLAAWTWAFPPAMRRAIGQWVRSRPWASGWRALTAPLSAWLLHALALWLGHVPRLFEAALHHAGWHALQHASFLGSALLFWWAVFGADPRAQTRGMAMVLLFTTMLHTGALGALLTLAPSAWYPGYAGTAAALGLDPVQDQQLGGLVMWIPGGLVYLVAGLAVMAQLLARRRPGPVMPTHPAVPPMPDVPAAVLSPTRPNAAPVRPTRNPRSRE